MDNGNRFIYNRHSGILHKDPPHERCNTDDIRPGDRHTLYSDEEKPALMMGRRRARHCGWCWPRWSEASHA
jgi:hypothetical protein